MTGIPFVTDAKGRKVGVLINITKHGARLEQFWDGLNWSPSPTIHGLV